MHTSKHTLHSIKSKVAQARVFVVGRIKRKWNKGVVSKISITLTVMLLVASTAMYGVGSWYVQKHKNEPVTFGTTFVPSYAREFGLDPKETMQAMIDDLGIRRFRLVSYWKEIEENEGVFVFSELDWQFEKANAAGAKVSLAIGLRQPRWPECHEPSWANNQDINVWYPKLRTYMTKVIERYKDNPALDSYQLENEFFLSVFGDCPDFSRWRLVEEYELVKSLDADTPIVVSRSNNATPSWPVGEPRADIVGAAVYKRVWDKTITKRYFEYPLPPWFYSFLAGATQLTTGKNTIIHELQTEAWLPEGYNMQTAPVDELYKSMNPEMLAARMDYAVKSGIKTIDLWGPEWWYHMKTVRGEPGLWETAKTELAKYQ